MRTESRRADGKMVLAVIAVLFFSSSVFIDAQKLYAMKMNAWAGTAGPIQVVQASDMQGFDALIPATAKPAPLAKTPRVAKPHAEKSPNAPTPVTVCAEGLTSPAGIAISRETGALYVSELYASRISIVASNHKDVAADASTPVYEMRDGRRTPADPIRSPEGLAFSPDGFLYTAENVAGGRIIRFSLDESGKAIDGLVIEIPGQWRDFEWEDIAFNAMGELLLAGSSIDTAIDGEVPVPFYGVLLFRDKNETWWLLHRSVFESFSSAAFSRDGLTAVYACEVSGNIGWIDLRNRELRQGNTTRWANNPQGLSILPDGRILIAEGGGSLFVFDPATCDYTPVCKTTGHFESVYYDAVQHRALVADEGGGKLLAIEFEQPIINPPRYALDEAKYENSHTPVHIPNTMPGFLANSLVRCGAFLPDTAGTPTVFRQFAEQVPMIALSAAVVPMDATATEADPIRFVQFLVLRPTAVTVTDAGVDMPVAAFAVVTASGKIIRTTFTNMDSAGMASLGLVQRDLGSVKVGLPYPFTAHVSADGICNIHFSGLMMTPDYHFVLNPAHPSESYMVVDRNDGKLWQYKLLPPNGETKSEHMVISYRRHAEQDWIQLGKSISEPADAPVQLTWAR